MIGVVPHQGGQVECDGKPSPTMLEQIFVALVGFLRRCKSRKLPHGIELAPVSRSVNAPGKRRRTGISEVLFHGPVLGKICRGVKAANWYARNRGEPCESLLIEIHTRGCPNRVLRRLFKCRRQCLLRPLFLY